MRNSNLEVISGPSYLIHPQNRRVEYAGGFKIIKPEVFKDTEPTLPTNNHIRQPVSSSRKTNTYPEQVETGVPLLPHREKFGYQYYHGEQDFSNFFGLEGDKYHICFNHHPDCKVCNACQMTNITSFNNNSFPTKIKVQPRPSSAYSKNNKDYKEPVITKQQRPQSANKSNKPLTPKDSNKQPQIQHPVYQYIEQPLPPKNPTVQQQNEYQQKYKEYLLRKRDLYYLNILKKLVDKIDFQRYQCTSPNEQRVHADWFGIYKPRTMQTTSGIVKYQLDYHAGYEFLKSFIFVYLQQGKYKQKQSYETNAQMFLNDLQDLLVETEKSEPTKALQKLNAQAYKRILEGKINKQKLNTFLNRLQFVSLAFNLTNIDEKLHKLPLQLSLEEYKRIFTMKIPPKQNNSLREYVEKKNSDKQSSRERFNFKPIFPQIESLQHTGIITQSIGKEGKKLSIRQKKLLADLVEKQMEERAHMNYKFKAKQIPKDVRDRSLYNKLLDSQAQKSAKNREESVKVLLQNQNPFSFYYRDLHKEKPTQQFKQYQSFKAKSIPRHVTQPRYQQLLEQKERLKKQHLQRRQQQLLSSSKFPATMSYLEDYQQISKPKRQQLPYSFKPNISGGEIPNFKQLHEKNLNQLEEKKEMNRTTVIQEFNLSKANKRKQPEIQILQKKKPKIMQSPQKYTSGSTLKFDALIEHRRKENEQREIKEAERQRELNLKPTKHQELLKSRVQQSVRQLDGPSAGSFVIPQSKWKEEDKQQMLHKVYDERPLLIDRKYIRLDGQKVEVQK